MAINRINEHIPYSAAGVTTSDTDANQFACLYIGTGGDLAVVSEKGDSVTFKSVPSGSYLWLRVVKVMATNTTASNIVGLN